jgi:hypothetical protein
MIEINSLSQATDLKTNGIELIEVKTRKAVDSFNRLLRENKKLLRVFIWGVNPKFPTLSAGNIPYPVLFSLPNQAQSST